MTKKIISMRPSVGTDELEAVKTVFESKYRTEGPATQEFEKQFAPPRRSKARHRHHFLHDQSGREVVEIVGKNDNFVVDTRDLLEPFSGAPNTSLEKGLKKAYYWHTTLG